MRIITFGNATVYSLHWCVYAARIVPEDLIDDIDPGTKFFVTKNIGSGLVIDSQYTSFPPTLARWRAICNDSANNVWLGYPRDDIEDLNPFYSKIVDSLITER